MDIELGQPVIAQDGEQIGDVERLIIDQEQRKVREFLIKEGTILSTDRIVDIDLITRIDEDGIHLSIPSDQADTLPAFVEGRYITPGEQELDTMPHAWIGAGGAGGGPLIWGPTGTAGTDPGQGSLFEPASTPSAHAQPDRPVDQSSVVIDTGTDVVDKEGESVGSVEEVHYDNSGRVSGFTVKTGMVFTNQLNIPLKWVDSLQPDAVRLAITSDEAEKSGKVDE